jgi:hypothetical protein
VGVLGGTIGGAAFRSARRHDVSVGGGDGIEGVRRGRRRADGAAEGVGNSQLFGIQAVDLVPPVRIRAEGVIVGGRYGPQVQAMAGLQAASMTLVEEGQVPGLVRSVSVARGLRHEQRL